jgi:hypothetical protein
MELENPTRYVETEVAMKIGAHASVAGKISNLRMNQWKFIFF